MGRRRRVFRQRKTFTRRLLGVAGWGLFLVAAVLGLAYVSLPWTANVVLAQILRAQDWGPVALHVEHCDIHGIALRDLALANNTVTAKRIVVSVSPLDIWRGQIREIAVTGVRISPHWSETGLRIGPLDLAAVPAAKRSSIAARLQLQRVTIADSEIAIPLGATVFATSVAADLAAQDDRWDGSITMETRVAEAAEPVFHIAWDGTFAPRDPATWHSHGTLDLNAPDVALAEGARLIGRGHLDVATGDGAISVTAPGRLDLSLAIPAPNVLASLPPMVANVLKDGLAIYLAGSAGGPTAAWQSTNGNTTQHIDIETGVQLGDAWLRATARGNATGPDGHAPDSATIAELKLAANRFPTAVGAVSGEARAIGGDDNRPQTAGIVVGSDGDIKAAVALTVAARAISIALPGGAEHADIVTFDLPRVRIEGSVAPLTMLYDVTASAEAATVSHTTADVRLGAISARFLPHSIEGSGEAALVRLLGRSRGEAAGVKVVANFKTARDTTEVHAVLKAGHDAEVGQLIVKTSNVIHNGEAHLTIPHLTFGNGGAFPIDNVTGSVSVTANAGWKDGERTSDGRIDVDGFGFQTPAVTVAGLTGGVTLTSLWPPRASAGQHLTAALVAFGLPFRDVTADVALPGDGTVTIGNIEAAIAGGHLSGENASLSLDNRAAKLTLAAKDIDLAAVATMGKVDGLSMTGHLSGTLPLAYDGNTWQVVEGRLHSDGTGHLSYRPPSPPVALNGRGEAIAKALTDFAYDGISVSVNGAPLQELSLWTNVKGKNPNLYGGSPISFALHLSGPLGAILPRGIVGYRTGSDLAARLKDQPATTP